MHATVEPALTGAALPAAGTAPLAAVRQTAFYLPSRGDGLFAWLHYRDKTPRLDHGVVLCPPVGYEQIHSHRSLRHLADALAREGFFALRFDYHGTGDSPGRDEDPERLAAWLANVRDAQSWLRDRVGCRHVSVVGLRLGAALAAKAAAEQPVDQLVLWAPVIKGGTYVREMRALGMAGRAEPGPASPSADVEAAGFVLTQETAAELRRLDLLQCVPRCRRLLVVSRDDLNAEARLLDHLAAAGVPADHAAPPGYAGMMAEPHENRVPRQAIADITAWLLEGPRRERPLDDEPDFADALPAEIRFGAPRVRERAVCLREQPRLFGIVTEPADGAPAARPAVLLLNAGSTYRVGPSRLYVLAARALAARGFRCLRLDLGGLGDSLGPDPRYENHPYPPTMFPDVEAALRRLKEQEGAGRVVLMGLCSGGYAAFQSAVHSADPAVVESVIINPLAFYWHEGMPLGPLPVSHLKQFDHLHRAARDPRKWLNLLTGKSTLGFRGIARVLAQHARLRLQPATPAPVEESQVFENGHPLHEDLPGDLERAVRAGRRLAFFFGTRDPSYRILMFHARRKVRELLRRDAVSLSFIDGADHTFTDRGPRESLVRSVCDYLAGRYGE